MIDIHCHFLPGIDDGAEDLPAALALARRAVEDGIYYSMLTPHIQPGRYENRAQGIRRHFEAFRAALEEAEIPLRIGMAAEVRLDLEVLPMLDRDEIPYIGEMGGDRVLLLEFPHTGIPVGSARFVERLLGRGIRPIIAHPERNRDVLHNVQKIAPFVEMGCPLQLTSGSLTGTFGRGVRRRARELLEYDGLKVLATDAHNLKLRPPVLSTGVAAAAHIIGQQAAHDLVYRNPALIVFGKRFPAKRLGHAASRQSAGIAVAGPPDQRA